VMTEPTSVDARGSMRTRSLAGAEEDARGQRGKL